MISLDASPAVRLCQGNKNLSKIELLHAQAELMNALAVLHSDSFPETLLKPTEGEFVRVEGEILFHLSQANEMLGLLSN